MDLCPFEWGNELPTLRADGIELRRLSDQDASAILAVFGDPDVTRYWSSPALQDVQDARRLIAEIQHHFHSRHLFQWGAALRDSSEVIGTCTLFGVSHDHRRAEIGFALRRSYWG